MSAKDRISGSMTESAVFIKRSNVTLDDLWDNLEFEWIEE
jgi:hypothetical protein